MCTCFLSDCLLLVESILQCACTFPLCGFRAEEGGNSFLHRRCAEVRSQASWCATTNSMAAPACLVTRCVREPVMRRSYVHGECFKYAILPWERWLGFQAPATPFIRRDPWSGRLGKHPTTAGTSMGRKGEGSDPQAGAASRLPSWPPPGQAMTCGGF